MTTASAVIIALSGAAATGACMSACILVANAWTEYRSRQFLRELLARDREYCEGLVIDIHEASGSGPQFPPSARGAIQADCVPVVKRACTSSGPGSSLPIPTASHGRIATPSPQLGGINLAARMVASGALRRL